MSTRSILFFFLFLLLASPSKADPSRHLLGEDPSVIGVGRLPSGFRPEVADPRPPGENLSAVARTDIKPEKPTDEGEPFREANGCVIIGFTKADGTTEDPAMAGANKYWNARKTYLKKLGKPYPRVLQVDSLERLFAALSICPPGGDINIDTHGFGGHGGGFCVNKGDENCLTTWDQKNLAKFAEAAGSRSPRAIWLNACQVAEGVKDSGLGNDEKIDASFANLLANRVHEESVRQKIEKAGEKGKVEALKPVRVHAFTTVVYGSPMRPPFSKEKDTVRVTFEADPEVQAAAGRRITAHNQGPKPKEPLMWLPPEWLDPPDAVTPFFPPRADPPFPGIALPAAPSRNEDEFLDLLKKIKGNPDEITRTWLNLAGPR
jgi:hypothetical protein